MRVTQVYSMHARGICIHLPQLSGGMFARVYSVDAFIALGGNADKTGEISTEKLRGIIKDFGLTIDIEVCAPALMYVAHA